MWLCTPPSETRPSRCSAEPRARANAWTNTGLCAERAGVDVVVDPHQILAHHSTRAEVGMSHLGVAHLAVRQADRSPRRLQRRMRELAPQPVEYGRPGQLDRVSRSRVGARPHPSSTTSAHRRGAHRRRVDDRPRKLSDVQAGAADQAAVDVGLGQQAGGVLGFHAAAVLDPHPRHRPHPAPRGCGRARPAPSREWRSARCRSPTPARRRSWSPPPAPASARPARPPGGRAPLGRAVAPLLLALTDGENHRQTSRHVQRPASRTRAASVSLKYWRRSEWPSRTPSTPRSVSIRAEISPVNAPSDA